MEVERRDGPLAAPCVAIGGFGSGKGWRGARAGARQWLHRSHADFGAVHITCRFACMEIVPENTFRIRSESILCLTWQQALASAPAPVAEAGTTADVVMPGIAPLTAPAPEAAGTLLLDELAAAAPSSEMLSNGSSVALLAQLRSLSKQHFNSHGGSNVTLLLDGFPLAWSAAGASCALLQLISVTALRSSSKVREHARLATGIGSPHVVLCFLDMTSRDLERFTRWPEAWWRSAGTQKKRMTAPS